MPTCWSMAIPTGPRFTAGGMPVAIASAGSCPTGPRNLAAEVSCGATPPAGCSSATGKECRALFDQAVQVGGVERLTDLLEADAHALELGMHLVDASILRRDMVDQPVERGRQGIVDTTGDRISGEDRVPGLWLRVVLGLGRDGARRDADRGRPGRNRLEHHRVR